jgi:hypothetical protein
MKQQLRKSFVLIVTMEYQNVRASVNFPPQIKGPSMLPGLCNRPILYFSRSPCTRLKYNIQKVLLVHQICSIIVYTNLLFNFFIVIQVMDCYSFQLILQLTVEEQIIIFSKLFHFLSHILIGKNNMVHYLYVF